MSLLKPGESAREHLLETLTIRSAPMGRELSLARCCLWSRLLKHGREGARRGDGIPACPTGEASPCC